MNDKEKKELLERLKNHKERLLQQIQNQTAEQFTNEQISKEEIKTHTCYYPETITYTYLFWFVSKGKIIHIPHENKHYLPCPICHSVYNTKRNNSTSQVQEEDETMKKRETE